MISSFVARLLADPVAFRVLVFMLVLQASLFLWFWHDTRRPLGKQIDALKKSVPRLSYTRSVSGAFEDGQLPVEVRRGLRVAYPDGDYEDSVEPRYALTPERLLPKSYNERLDTAAPGLFTALGILGTFLGLLLAFFGLDFSDPARSIAPLIGGMSIAFLNSLAGVFLSIIWTIASRKQRHRFDQATRALVIEVEGRFRREAYGTRMLRTLVELRTEMADQRRQSRVAIVGASRYAQRMRALQEASTGQLAEELRELRLATSGASKDLLESLAPKLEESFRALVNLPFERLTQSVDDFREVVNAASERSDRTLAALDASIESVRQSQDGLEKITQAATASAEAFHGGVEALRAGAEAAGAVVTESRRAAEALTSSSKTFMEVAKRQELVAGSLDKTVAGLESASASVAGAAERFSEGGDRLEAAAESITSATFESVKTLLESIRSEVEAAVTGMTTSLTEFGERTVAAYDQSSSRLVENLDARVSDLNDRLSAELNTLAARLPESASEITRAADVLRKRLDVAVRGLEQAVKQLDVSSSQSLKARLEEYDKLVARAVDHFSGTLSTWDGRLKELDDVGRTWSTAMRDFQRESSATLTNTHASVEAAASAAHAAAKAAGAVQSTVEHFATISGGVPKPPASAKVPNGVGAIDSRTQEPA